MEVREDEEKLTEEQRKRAEANRAAALAKRKAILSRSEETAKPWKLFKCSKPTDNFPLFKQPEIVKRVEIPQKFLARLEICSADSFSVSPVALEGFKFSGEQVCFEKLTDCLSNVVSSHCTQNTGGGKACVYKLEDYQCVLRSLKSCAAIQCEEIPWATLNVIERLSHSYFAGKWIPCRPEHLPDETVDELIAGLPKILCNALLPFQLDGLRFGLRRGGRCLIADEMGLGKTLQAIAIAGCFMKEGSILVVCPAILRYSWAEELERWFPYCLPTDVHLVFGHQDNPARLPKQPRVVVTSYRMLSRLHKSILEQEWATLIVDESHHLHCTKSSSEKDELKAVLDVAMKVKHLILLSGTPSLSRPGLLGKTKYEFAKTYCDLTFIKPCHGKAFTDYSKGKRLEELNVLLKQSVMIRRLKEHVLPQLPPKRRKIINLVLRRSDINLAAETLGIESGDTSVDCVNGNSPVEEDEDTHMKKVLSTSLSALGIAKLPGFFEWLSIHPIIREVHGEESREESSGSRKMIIFCYHHKVLDGVQAFLCEAGIQFVRIDCNVTGSDRQSAVQTFQYSKEVRIALIGIRSGGSGLNLTAADNVVFLELPLRPADIQQAEDRAHRHGQKKLVNIYIFCAKDTVDESHWRRLNKSLLRVSSTVNGKHGVMREIEVESVSYFETTARLNERIIPESTGDQNNPRVNFMKSQDSSSNQDLHFVSSCGDSTVNIYGGEQDDHNVISSLRSRPQVEVETTLPQTSSNDNGKAVEVWSGVNCSFQDTLRFEVSRYTGRIHLYTCISGPDYRPQPLFENFRQEEVEFHKLSKDGEKVTDKASTDNQLYRKACMAFIAEWNELTPMDKKKLTGKPLQLPLSCELCYLNESHNHDNGGLLKGGSKRRKTPREEISCPLPSNADWRKVGLRSRQGQKEILYSQGWSDLDEPLCKLCQTPCKSKNAKVPQYFEDLFCSLDCFEEYRYRTSNGFLRQELFKIEKGVCTKCRLDCHGLVKHLKPLSLKIRQAYVERQAPIIATHKKLLDRLVRDPSEGNAWHADHIIPVYKGGGECKLENMRTLCVACHAAVTSEQCGERRVARKEAKKRIKDIMNGRIIDCDLDFPDKEEDHNLLLDIPGSAYSVITNYKEIVDGRNDKANPACLNSQEKASQEFENPCDHPESNSNNTENEEHTKQLLKSVQIVYTESGQALKVSEYGKIDA